MNCYGEENPCCYFHTNEVIVGICALCLKERLIDLAAKQRHHHHLPNSKDTHTSFAALRRKSTIALPRVFALGSFLLRFESRRERPDDGSDDGSIASLEDSFISIKFEDNGRALWDKKGAAAASLEQSNGNGVTCNQGMAMESKGAGSVVVEHMAKQRGELRWRKRIGHLLQMARWKRSSKAGPCHVGVAAGKAGAEGVKGRRGWIRSLTRRRTTSTTD